ncbi:STAS domain-containing protein [Streptomyces sp. NPDC006691]|uniref:STAS domain-containing protein n=1 Tax=Streptomyces sp. NPDC006691 TaxID=3364757 RepID=UPI0036CA2316
MHPLKITTREAVTGPVVEINGDLDYETAPQLRNALSALALEPGQCLVLDLGGLKFCDSSGIAAMIAGHNLARAAQAEIALAAVPPDTLRILRIVGLDHVFTLRPGSTRKTG